MKIRARIEERSKVPPRDHRAAVRDDDRVRHRVDPGRQRQGQDQDQARRRQHRRQGRDPRPPAPGRRAREGDPAALRLHGLPGGDLALGLRDRPATSPSSSASREILKRSVDKTVALLKRELRDQAGRARAAVALGFARAHLHRGAHLPADREVEDLGERPRRDPRGPEALRQAAAPRGRRRRHRPPDRDPHQAHLRLQPLPGGREAEEDRGGDEGGEATT